MKREIKFRGWNKLSEQMQRVVRLDMFFTKYDEVVLMDDEGDANLYFLDQVPLMQYTGLKDENGEEIYEGDVVDCFAGEHHHGVWEHHKRYVVEFGWTECMWEMLNCDLIEVLGNIYENPELLKGEME